LSTSRSEPHPWRARATDEAHCCQPAIRRLHARQVRGGASLFGLSSQPSSRLDSSRLTSTEASSYDIARSRAKGAIPRATPSRHDSRNRRRRPALQPADRKRPAGSGAQDPHTHDLSSRGQFVSVRWVMRTSQLRLPGVLARVSPAPRPAQTGAELTSPQARISAEPRPRVGAERGCTTRTPGRISSPGCAADFQLTRGLPATPGGRGGRHLQGARLRLPSGAKGRRSAQCAVTGRWRVRALPL
jgi:hypothetical protein